MDAYTLVDGPTRRNMESMLKTWKEPVPGSLDPRPVFPYEAVQPIDSALARAKTAMLQNTRPAQMHPNGQYRHTPTPPQHNGYYGAPPAAGPAPSQQHQSYPNYHVRKVLCTAEACLLIVWLTAFRCHLKHSLGSHLSRQHRSSINKHLTRLPSSNR